MVDISTLARNIFLELSQITIPAPQAQLVVNITNYLNAILSAESARLSEAAKKTQEEVVSADHSGDTEAGS